MISQRGSNVLDSMSNGSWNTQKTKVREDPNAPPKAIQNKIISSSGRRANKKTRTPNNIANPYSIQRKSTRIISTLRSKVNNTRYFSRASPSSTSAREGGTYNYQSSTSRYCLI